MNANEQTHFKWGLRRLDPEQYKGRQTIHWTHAIKDRAEGWLNSKHHNQLKDILLHCLSRQRLCCPIYCLMPDHAHLVWMGMTQKSDQIKSNQIFRRSWNTILCPLSLQSQCFDELINANDTSRENLPALIRYISENPVRAGLVSSIEDWPYWGTIFPGYPSLDPKRFHFWSNFWKAYYEQCDLI